MNPPRPAHATKEETYLHYALPQQLGELRLRQDSAAATTTGTTLWLGGQVLCVYVLGLYGVGGRGPGKAGRLGRGRRGSTAKTAGVASTTITTTTITTTTTTATKSRGTVLELGAGIGLTSIALAAAGWTVTATDVAEVVHGVLGENVRDPHNRGVGAGVGRGGSVCAEVLDWCDFMPAAPSSSPIQYDLILTSDTLFTSSLISPLFHTIRAHSSRETMIYIALEVRDTAVIAAALECAKDMGFTLKKVPRPRLRKCLRSSGIAWAEEDWGGVEVWAGRWCG